MAFALATVMVVSACQEVAVDEADLTPAVPNTALEMVPAEDTTSTNTVVTAVAHEPIWVVVRYRSDPVDLAYPGRFDVVIPDSTVVSAAAFDSESEYLLIALNGVWYHYCSVPGSVWSAFGEASSKGRFYNSELRGRYDCRGGGVPDYR